MVFTLTEELVKKGHDVSLFASGDSITTAKLISVYPRSLREAKIGNLYGLNDLSLLHIGNAYIKQNEFDLIHDHNTQMSLLAAQFVTKPTVITVHGAFSPTSRRVFENFNRPYYVSISNSQANSAPNVNWVANIYNGLYMNDYPFTQDCDDYLLFVGRISEEKGVHLAIETAEALDMPLIIAAKLDTKDVTYFREYVEPRLNNDHIRWIGEVDETERNRLMSRALCLLHPVTWKEPFGLVMIEAMACGCPVIAFNKGSISEIVEHEKTGFVVEDIDGMIEAVSKIKEIDRNYCRTYAIGKFSGEKMGDEYEKLYYKIVDMSLRGA